MDGSEDEEESRGRSKSLKREERSRSRSGSPKSRAKKAASGGTAKAAAQALRECPRKSGAGSMEHMEQRWKDYKGDLKKENWENVYWANMVKASESRKAVEAYQKTLLLSDPSMKELEVSVDVPPETNSEGKTTRRIDITDDRDKPTKAIEHKTGYQSLSVDIKSEVDRDAWLVANKDMDITWHFEDRGGKEPSKPLLEYLKKNGIKITMD
jgi:hypothetical protein